MAQRSNKKQPVYSADTLALRYIGGLALVALGVMMFLAVEMNMTGNVFDALRQVCFGLTGGLALLFPVLPVWAGVLVIWSSQKKAPVRPFVFAVFAFLGLCAFVVLVTKIGTEEYLAVLSRTSDGSWGGVIHQGYMQSVLRRASGGALGIILAYPFWSLVGTILGAAVTMILMLLCVLLALNLTPGRIRDLTAGRGTAGLPWRKRDRGDQDQQQIAFQQEQERQRQIAYAQQQAYILQQQQQAQARGAGQRSGKWPQPQQPAWNPGYTDGQNRANQQPAGGNRPWPAQNSPVTDESVLDWQQQLTNEKASANSGRQSVIFDQPQTGKQEKKSRIFGASREADAPKSSWIFGRKKSEPDGLSDLSEAEKRAEGMAYPAGSRLKAQPSRTRTAMEQVEEDLDKWRDPEKIQPREEKSSIRQERETPAFSGNQFQSSSAGPRQPSSGEAFAGEAGREKQSSYQTENDSEMRPETGKPVFETEAEPEVRVSLGRTSSARKEKEAQRTPSGSPWMDQVIAAEKASGGEKRSLNDENEYPEPKKQGRSDMEKREPEQLKIPVVEQTIANPTWKPELKHVEPKEEEEEEQYWEPTPYYAPPITDLKKPEASVLDTSREDEERSRRLEETLANFKVQARVVHVTHGPAISRFEMELAPGTKVGKVAELEKDIIYGMQATSVRIQAPIPGKSLVGVEVPNPKRATVTLREVLESQPMQNAKSILTVALGKDIAGVPIVCDLARMPHLLIAGATGSGKSVCINTIINSLLFRAGPDEVKMILIDPKVVELQCYNGIPHLLLPVVNDPHKASAALAWAVAEMMERYDKFSERGVRNLEGYNNILGPGEKPMPRIVIIIDELADLMMVCKKDVEEYICRITQLARAAGIHLIVATQRPSVDVITGLIKANIPSRIAFKTASYVDSRTILDRNGSEQLLGWGDMLYLPTGSFEPTRIQGCFLSDEEVNRIADHVRQANPSAYDPDVLDKLEQLSKGQEEGPGMDVIGGTPENATGDAELFAQAVEYAIADGQISTSTLQRRLKVGYARAGRLTDEMEERGIVAAKDGSKPRKCLITREQWEAMRASGQ